MKSSDDWSIGELAAQFGLATHVLRHWEQMGLLTPTRRVAGRRRYSPDHRTRIAVILRGKQAGLSLEQLRDLIATPDPTDRAQLLRRHHATLTERINQTRAAQQMIEHAMTCSERDFTQCATFRALLTATEPACGCPPPHQPAPVASQRVIAGDEARPK